MNGNPNFGAFVISLDFELHWGLRDHVPLDSPYRKNLLGVRQVIPALLRLFEEYEIAATWATVGFLFAESKDELESYKPKILPNYGNQSLFPYDEKIGRNEDEDPFHYAPTLIKLIGETPRQEIATHTFSHYYCLDSGQSKEAFAADIDSAIKIANARGVRPKSIVFPRNQYNSLYEDVLIQNGINCYRGNQKAWMYEISEGKQRSVPRRAARLIDTYISIAGAHAFDWSEVWKRKVANVPASFFLRPAKKNRGQFEKLRLNRLQQSVKFAAENQQIFHLWWHPHNFGADVDANISFLREVLDSFKQCESLYGMKSLSMHETALAADIRKLGVGAKL